jgi:hypothetical protein
MSDMTAKEGVGDRRMFFKTIGRTLVIGLTGGTVAYMVKSGRISTCINELSPCSSCIVLKQGCELPKAVEHRKQESDAKF